MDDARQVGARQNDARFDAYDFDYGPGRLCGHQNFHENKVINL